MKQNEDSFRSKPMSYLARFTSLKRRKRRILTDEEREELDSLIAKIKADKNKEV